MIKPTEQQRRVWELVAKGHPNKIIAHILQREESTVKVHIRHLMLRLGTTNRVQLALAYHGIEWSDKT